MTVEKLDKIGWSVVGCGTIGRIRAGFARQYPGVGWLGLCDLKEDLGRKLAEDTEADFLRPTSGSFWIGRRSTPS